MPRDNDTPVCSQSQRQCYESAEESLMLTVVRHHSEKGSEKDKISKADCNCLPSCTSINYDAEVYETDYDSASVIEAFRASLDEDLSEFDNATLSRIRIFFKEAQFTSSKRFESSGWLDFVANCGGLLGKCISLIKGLLQN